MSSSHVTLCGRRDFANVIKLRILRCGGYPELLAWAPCNYKDPYKKEARRSTAGGNGMTEAGVGMIHFKDKRRGYKPKSADVL